MYACSKMCLRLLTMEGLWAQKCIHYYYYYYQCQKRRSSRSNLLVWPGPPPGWVLASSWQQERRPWTSGSSRLAAFASWSAATPCSCRQRESHWWCESDTRRKLKRFSWRRKRAAHHQLPSPKRIRLKYVQLGAFWLLNSRIFTQDYFCGSLTCVSKKTQIQLNKKQDCRY